MSHPASDAVAVYPEFVSREECAAVIAAFERLRPNYAMYMGDKLWDYNVVYPPPFIEYEPEIAELLRSWHVETLAVVREYVELGRTLYSDCYHVVRWPEGQVLHPHQDNQEADGGPNGTPWRDWSGLIYLNDDYEGGEIWFPECGPSSYKPVTGAFVTFPSHFKHGVKPVRNGTRYTAPGWYTFDEMHGDMSFLPC